MSMPRKFIPSLLFCHSTPSGLGQDVTKDLTFVSDLKTTSEFSVESVAFGTSATLIKNVFFFCFQKGFAKLYARTKKFILD